VVDGSVLPEEATLSVPGRHNRVNAATALRAVEAALRMEGVDPSRGRIIEALRGFGGLEHRLRLVGVARGVRYYNDSKSTTPESALRAIDAVSEQPGVGIGRVHLIAGGYDKKIDLSSIAQRMLGGAGLYTIGATGDMLAELARSGGMASERVHQCCTLAAAFAACAGRAGEGEAVVLSPGCASWDQYVNFEARGEEFVRLVRGLA
jgi:UDP-N-acetylmuramoylalanine--D-glutamate ligase